MRKRQTLSLLLLLFINYSFAQNMQLQRIDSLYPSVFFSYVYKNPATKRFMELPSYWEISSSYIINNKKVLPQKGNKTSAFIFNTESFLQKNDNLFFGNICYTQGIKKNVLRNETSDYELVYPYIVADTEGGDMYFEEYIFKGGYSGILKTISYGLEASYRANYEYRKTDPRPKNIVSQYALSMGLSTKVLGRYILGLSANIDVYNQNNSIRLFRKDASQKFLFLRGFGFYDRSFSKVYRNLTTYYDITKWNVSMQLFPDNAKGLYANILLSKSSLEQDIGEFNDVNVNKLSSVESIFNLGYKYKSKYLLKMFVLSKAKTGLENIYNQESYNNYKFVTSLNKYKSLNYSFGLSNLLFVKKSKMELQLNLIYDISKEEYISPSHLQKIDNITASLSANKILSSSFKVRVKTAYIKNLDSQIVMPDFAFLAKDKFMSRIDLSYYYSLSRTSLLEIKGTYGIDKIIKDSKYNNIEITASISF